MHTSSCKLDNKFSGPEDSKVTDLSGNRLERLFGVKGFTVSKRRSNLLPLKRGNKQHRDQARMRIWFIFDPHRPQLPVTFQN